MTASSIPILSTIPLQSTVAAGMLMSWYLIELLPELITKIFIWLFVENMMLPM